MAATAANPLNLLPNTVDLSTLSHSELRSLSLLSNPTLPSIDTGTTVEINSSFFNESASTRQQTYSTTPQHHRHHRHANTTTASAFSENDRAESISIVGFLKRYLQPVSFKEATIAKKKRREGEIGRSSLVEIVNKNGVVVDLAALEEVDEEREDEGGGGPFAEELRRRATGREKEEELLEVLAGIEGRWGSHRRKRRIVSASLLGDALPVGWEVVIALRRKGGRFSPYCRRYISPTGEQFSSCKEVATYLKSHLGINDTELLRDSRGESQQLQRVDVNNKQYANSKDGYSLLDVSNSSISNTCLPVKYDKDVSVSGIDNLPDVQVGDLYECHTCNVTFDVKDDYLQHLLLTHKRTTKEYKLGSSVGDEVIIRDANYECHTSNLKSFDVKDKYLQHQLSTRKSGIKRRRLRSSVADGVIIRDGKYECQFCHKVFEERRRYLGHVGNHVKGSISTPKELLLQAGLPSMDRQKAKGGNPNMDALIVVAQSSIQDVLPSVLEKQPSCVDDFNQSSVADFNKIQNADGDSEKVSSTRVDELDAENCGGEGRALSSLLNPCNKGRRTLSAGPTEPETGNDKWRGKTLSQSPCKKVREVSMTTEEINGSLPCLDEHDTNKISPAANIISNELYSCDRVRQILMADELINNSAHLPSDLEMEKDGRDKSSSLSLNYHAELNEKNMIDGQTKEQSYTSDIMDFEKNSCLDTMMIPGVDTYIHGDGDTTGKSTTTEDEGSANESEGKYDVEFLSYNQKGSEGDAAGDIVQSEYMNKRELEHVHKDDDSNLAIVTGDATAIACTAPHTSLNSSSPFDEIFGKAGQNICSLDPNLESGSAFAYMIQPQMYKYNAMGGEDSMLLPEVSMDLEKDNGFDLEFNASAKAESDLLGEIDSSSMTAMVCVWCGLEFFHETVEIEPQPDSVGFMCPTCRAKISKQFNELESNFSVNPQYS